MTKTYSFLLFIIFQASIFAEQIIDPNPVAVIQGSESLLENPAEICFSPNGNTIAVVDNKKEAILLFSKKNSLSKNFSKIPHQVFYSPKQHIDPMGLDFHPSGNRLAVGSLNYGSIYSYQFSRNKITAKNSTFIDGTGYGFNNPIDLAFTPDHNFLAVACNGSKYFILFYKSDQKGNFRLKSVFNLKREILDTYHLAGPNGLAFSQNGSLLATIHQRHDESENGLSAVAIFSKQPKGKKHDLYKVQSILYYGEEQLSALSFHPSGNYLAVVGDSNRVILLEKAINSNSFHEVQRFFIDEVEYCNGVAFSPEGDSLIISTNDPSLLIFDITIDQDEI